MDTPATIMFVTDTTYAWLSSLIVVMHSTLYLATKDFGEQYKVWVLSGGACTIIVP